MNRYRSLCLVNTLRPKQDGRRFPDDTFEQIFLKENVIILIKISVKFVPNGPIDNIPALVQIMAWRRPGDKPLSEPMMARLPTHICVTRPQWVKGTASIKDSLKLWWLELTTTCAVGGRHRAYDFRLRDKLQYQWTVCDNVYCLGIIFAASNSYLLVVIPCSSPHFIFNPE